MMPMWSAEGTMSADRKRKSVCVAMYLGLFGPSGHLCDICRKEAGLAVWLCSGELLLARLCRTHERDVPPSSIVEGLFERRGLPTHGLRGRLGGRA